MRGTRSTVITRPVLYQLGRAGERFFVGEGPVDLGARPRPVVLGRREDASADADVLVDDPWMSSLHARIVDGPRGGDRLFIEDCGSRNGICVNGVATRRAPLLHGDIVETGRTFWVFVEERSEPLLSSAAEFGAMATWHPRLGLQLATLAGRARGGEHVLVAGPPGSGKGFLARTLHQMSRREGRLVQLDCRERGPRDVAVELFGVEPGGGRIVDAAGGTLLLENVDRLPQDLQVRLVEALRRRAPDIKGRPPARVVATVGADVDALVQGGALARALVEALGVLRVDMPALEERRCDLGVLLDDCIGRARGATAIAREACRAMFRAKYPQNVRGFARVIEAAASLASGDDTRRKGGMIELVHLPLCVTGPEALRGLAAEAKLLEQDVGLTGEVMVPPPTADSASRPFDDAVATGSEVDAFRPMPATDAQPPRNPLRTGTAAGLDRPAPIEAPLPVDADALVGALRGARGNVSAAARILGRPRAVVLRWLRDLNIDPLAHR
jgi:DNA-binding NtrC family response regulator